MPNLGRDLVPLDIEIIKEEDSKSTPTSPVEKESHFTDGTTTLKERRTVLNTSVPEVGASDLSEHATFAQSGFETIIRRQRNNGSHGLKIANAPMWFPNLDADWQFAGWGSSRYLEISLAELCAAEERITVQPTQMGQFRATSISANGVLGSVFYAFPAVAAASAIFSPISLAIACLILFLFRPILLELGSAVKMNGANYTYLLQFSGKIIGIAGAAATLLDAIATSAVSAATAAAYLAGEFEHFPIAQSVLAICLLAALTLAALVSMRESTGLTLAFTFLHILTMAALMIASVVAWSQNGSAVLSHNWACRPAGTSAIARSIFNGVCLGFLGITGFECTPCYIENIKPSAYPAVLRNLLYGALILNAPLMLFVYALVPQETILSGANVLSILAEIVAGRWLRIIIVVDCMSVLAGGILTGLFTTCGLFDRLARDCVLPPIFLHTLPVTGSSYVSIAFFFILCIVLYGSSGFSLSTISAVFSVSFLVVMGLYTISSLFLKFRHHRLPRSYIANIWCTLIALAVIIVVIVGNVVQNPKILGLFVAYIFVIFVCLTLRTYQLGFAKLCMSLYDQMKWSHRYSWDKPLVRWIRRLQRVPVCVWVKTDDIFSLLQACLYVRKNETTARLIFIYAYETPESIPSELKANSKILDEAFPAITIDLVFLKGQFSPILVEAAREKLDIPLGQSFMFSPSDRHEWELAQYRGMRVIG